MEDYELVEEFEKLWNRAPKHIPLRGRRGSSPTFLLLFAVGGLRVYAELSVGVRGGITERVYVFDPSEGVVADRLLIACTDGDGSGRGALLPLADLRKQVQKLPQNARRDRAMELCNNAMWDLAEKIDNDVITPAQLRRIESTSQSLAGLMQGGLPSHGRQGGGTRR